MKHHYKLWLFIINGLICLFLPFITEKFYNAFFFQKTTYYILWFTLFALIFLLTKKITRFKMIWREHKNNLLILLFLNFLLSIIIFNSINCEFRVLSDETNHLNVSQAIFNEKEIYHPSQGLFWNEKVSFTKKGIPLRPVFFPFLLSLVHSFNGYNANNVFILNFIIGFLIFITYSIFTYTHTNLSFSMIANLMLFSIPVFLLNITSAGFGAINLLMLILLSIAAYNFIKNHI